MKVEKYDERLLISQLSEPKQQRKAFEMVVRQYSEQLYWQIRRIVLIHDDANDVLQNVLLYRIALNESLDFVRRKRPQVGLGEDAAAGVADMLMADKYFDGDLAEARLQEAIAKLPDVQRAVFNLRYYENMKYSEISKITGTSEGALKASYHIAVKKISDYFKSHD